MTRSPRFRAFALAATLLAAPLLAGCDSGDKSGFNVDTYVGTYAGTGTLTATGQPSLSAPFTATIAKTSSTGMTMTFNVASTPPSTVTLVGTYNGDGATFVATSGAPTYNLKISPNGTFSGTYEGTSTVSGAITRTSFDLKLSGTGGMIHYVGTRR